MGALTHIFRYQAPPLPHGSCFYLLSVPSSEACRPLFPVHLYIPSLPPFSAFMTVIVMPRLHMRTPWGDWKTKPIESECLGVTPLHPSTSSGTKMEVPRLHSQAVPGAHCFCDNPPALFPNSSCSIYSSCPCQITKIPFSLCYLHSSEAISGPTRTINLCMNK